MVVQTYVVGQQFDSSRYNTAPLSRFYKMIDRVSMLTLDKTYETTNYITLNFAATRDSFIMSALSGWGDYWFFKHYRTLSTWISNSQSQTKTMF